MMVDTAAVHATTATTPCHLLFGNDGRLSVRAAGVLCGVVALPRSCATHACNCGRPIPPRCFANIVCVDYSAAKTSAGGAKPTRKRDRVAGMFKALVRGKEMKNIRDTVGNAVLFIASVVVVAKYGDMLNF